MKRLAIVPARGGSKRIPNKNVRDFCGKPMMCHVLQAAHESGLFEKIHVSTESAMIVDCAQSYGFPVDFMRSDSLADDHTPIMPVLKFVMQKYEEAGSVFDQIWILMACAPLVTAADLVGAEELFRKSAAKSPVLAVSEFQQPIEWALRREAEGRMVPLQPGMFSVRSQDLERRYFDAGAFAIYPPEVITSAPEAGSDSFFVGYVLPKGSAVDIDDAHDWALAEALYRIRSGAGSI
jgi:pseudaminic acid cytidylyltransferase